MTLQILIAAKSNIIAVPFCEETGMVILNDTR
jgi:hypothetical protein